MSSFTRFDGELSIEPAVRESELLGSPYYRVLSPFRYYIGREGSAYWIDISRGYLTDGASVPSMFQWLIPPIGRYAQAAVVHDKLCETLTVFSEERKTMVSITRKLADEIFLEAMKVLKVPGWKRRLMFTAVSAYRVAKCVSQPSINRKKLMLQMEWIKDNPFTDEAG